MADHPTSPDEPAPQPQPALTAWFARRGWAPFAFQQQVWAAMAEGRSGLLHATTGAGKTLAAGLGALGRAQALGLWVPPELPAPDLLQASAAPAPAPTGRPALVPPAPPLQLLWITPMRALAADTLRALTLPFSDLAPQWTLGLRSGDTSSAERARQDRRLPTVLVTTPESLTLLLTRADARERLGAIHTVVVDEWHEQVGNKRGVQLQLALARLATFRAEAAAAPRLSADAGPAGGSGPAGPAVWGLSATLGNLPEALAMLLGPQAMAATPAPVLVQGRVDKTLVVDTLLPAHPGRFAWGGHLGAQMRQPVADEIARTADHPDPAQRGSTLVFTNVRSQAEAWYQMLLAERPDWAGRIALHHGSLDKSVRDWVEAGLRKPPGDGLRPPPPPEGNASARERPVADADGGLIAVVATSSLDLGVDFVPVARVLQIGSAKGVARLLQRAGRSGHQPGRVSRITLVPTNTLELIEAVAARQAIAAGQVEPRHAPEQPLDVLVQHLVTVALGGGFTADNVLAEVRRTWSYRALSQADFDWALAFVTHGGASLGAYPEYHRVVRGDDGVHRVPDRGIAQRHRLQVGTIVGETAIAVKWWSQAGGGGASLGQVEESFIARLNPGDCFVFAGRVLEYVRTREMVAWVKRASGKRGIVPSWAGGKMSLSSELADATLAVLQGVTAADPTPDLSILLQPGAEPELRAAQPMLAAQARLSHLPAPGRLLLERHRSREGWHLFLYPFAGRSVHLGLASLLAWRLARDQPNTFSISVNDYGFELLAAEDVDLGPLLDGRALQDDGGATLADAPAAPPNPQPNPQPTPHNAAATPLLHDVLASLNSSELARKRFREIARVAGLVFTGYPGAPSSTRQLQASAGLFYEVFRQYDPANRLLGQAEGEVLAQELDIARLSATLARLRGLRLDAVDLAAPSPFALALMVERFREQLTTEKLADRLARIVADAEALLGGEAEGLADGSLPLADTPPPRARTPKSTRSRRGAVRRQNPASPR